MNYWDTSALAKLYVAEADSDVYLNLAAAETTIPAISELSRVELLAALHRKALSGELPGDQTQQIHAQLVADIDAATIRVFPVGAACFREAERVVTSAYASHPPVPIRTLDALHVAIALMEGAPAIVSSDARQRVVAAFMGLGTLP